VIIEKKTVSEVVDEASRKMKDPNYSAVLVGGFVQDHASAAQYVSAYATDVGGAEGVVNTIFHAAIIGVCFQRGYGRSVPALAFDDLDRVSSGDRRASLEQRQPFVLEYIESNVDNESMRSILMLLALAMESVSR